MIPYYARVAAFDDDQEHLRNIVIGLGKAGFWAMPFWYDAGKFEPELPCPFQGIRLVFSDIHLGPPSTNIVVYASAIINGLKKVVAEGPYGLIFWSKFPTDAQLVWDEIAARAESAGLTLPIFWGTIDKNKVMDLGGAEVGAGSNLDADKLRDEILDLIKSADVLALSMSWDERVGHAAMHATNRIYRLANPLANPSNWANLLAYLAQEALGNERAIKSPIAAVDNAMLPLLEDKISEITQDIHHDHQDVGHSIGELLKNGHINLPAGISAADLNTHYLVEEIDQTTSHMWERGMVSRLGGGYRNSGKFIGHFGVDVENLIKDEFILPNKRKEPIASDIVRDAQLHFVELSAECDQTQGKMVTHRYLLALCVPASLQKGFNVYDSKRCKFRDEYSNSSIINIGEIKLKEQKENHFLLVSTRRFMTLPPKDKVDVKCIFRLRRTVIEELSHHYATYSRRPGVMRFS